MSTNTLRGDYVNGMEEAPEFLLERIRRQNGERSRNR